MSIKENFEFHVDHKSSADYMKACKEGDVLLMAWALPSAANAWEVAAEKVRLVREFEHYPPIDLT